MKEIEVKSIPSTFKKGGKSKADARRKAIPDREGKVGSKISLGNTRREILTDLPLAHTRRSEP